MNRNEITQSNQTEFVDQVQFAEPQKGRSFRWQDIKKNKNLLPFYILIALFFFFIFLFLLRSMFAPKPDPEPVFNLNEEVVELGPLNKRAYELREELKEHNPTKQLLPFPQVDLEFNIY